MRNSQGQWAEDYACLYLQQQGLTLITRNYHSRYGEIDLIMQDKTALIFIEVRYRRGKKYGDSADSINMRKQQKIHLTAEHYLQHHLTYQNFMCRFDVILLDGNPQQPILRWIPNAFQAVG